MRPDTIPRGVLGVNAAMMEGSLKFVANRCLSEIGLKEEYPGTTNPLPWMPNKQLSPVALEKYVLSLART